MLSLLLGDRIDVYKYTADNQSCSDPVINASGRG